MQQRHFSEAVVFIFRDLPQLRTTCCDMLVLGFQASKGTRTQDPSNSASHPFDWRVPAQLLMASRTVISLSQANQAFHWLLTNDETAKFYSKPAKMALKFTGAFGPHWLLGSDGNVWASPSDRTSKESGQGRPQKPAKRKRSQWFKGFVPLQVSLP
jgi:hypothetical protein